MCTCLQNSRGVTRIKKKTEVLGSFRRRGEGGAEEGES